VPDFQFTSLDVDLRWARGNRDLLLRFLRGFLRAHEKFYTDQAFARDVAMRHRLRPGRQQLQHVEGPGSGLDQPRPPIQSRFRTVFEIPNSATSIKSAAIGDRHRGKGADGAMGFAAAERLRAMMNAISAAVVGVMAQLLLTLMALQQQQLTLAQLSLRQSLLP
jgi:hypothetical protein